MNNANQENDPMLGRKLGDFLVESRLGEGGFGLVYNAKQLTLTREAVIKILHTKHTSDLRMTSRFMKEAKMASSLEHPYVAHIYSFGVEEDGLMWIAMEFVRGIPLDAYLKTNSVIPIDKFIPLLEKICEVIHTAHDYGIIHRDIKPANIMLIERAGQLLPKLLDFGIAKDFDATGKTETEVIDSSIETDNKKTEFTDDKSNTKQNKTPSTDPNNISTNPNNTLSNTIGIIGSPRYMAPEQWATSKVDARADIYSLGILAYECLTGRPPFEGEYYALAYAHAAKAVPPLTSNLPAALNDVMSKVMAKEPGERYSTTIEFMDAFKKASETKKTSSETKTVGSPLKSYKMAVFIFSIFLVLVISASLFFKAKTENPNSHNTPNNMAYIPAGNAVIGRNDTGDELEKPLHTVPVPTGFYMDKFETTNKDFQNFVESTGLSKMSHWLNYYASNENPSLPVVKVTLEEAEDYCRWKGEQIGLRCKLPTETEWEYAARGKANSIYAWGNQWAEGYANANNTNGKIAPVGSNKMDVNSYGLFDLTGNVREFTRSYFKSYPGSTANAPNGTKIVRGGAFSDPPDLATFTFRGFLPTNENRYDRTGFRCVCELSK